MENIARITAHCERKLLEAGESRDCVMHFLSRENGENYLMEEGAFWRICEFVPETVAYNSCEDPEILCAAGRAFGRFQTMLSDFDAALLHETIPDFHNTEKRYLTLDEHIKADEVGRVASVRAELDELERMRPYAIRLCEMLKSGELPLRVTHNDTKINNVLFDAKTGKEKTVIDLDTVMPGLVAYDFGDAIRFGAASAAEDERDLSKMYMDITKFAAFTRGYLETMRPVITARELELLPFAARLMTYECGIRFLTDHLNGDTYFRIHRAGHNLDRARTQFKLVADMEAKDAEMRHIVSELWAWGQ